MVKNNNFTKGLMAAMLLASPLAGATEYPASDFQPKVVYSDSDYKHTESAPAASTSSKKASKPDPRYPAANFEPKVLYKDSGYKHKADTVAAPKASSAASTSSAEAVAESAQEGSDNTMLFGLIALAAVGFFFFRKGGAAASAPARSTGSAPASAYRAEQGGLTGVAKYLADKEVKVTGVARYLESKEQSEPTTGVAKYMAKQVVAARQAAAERVTGVEKYLRNKG